MNQPIDIILETIYRFTDAQQLKNYCSSNKHLYNTCNQYKDVISKRILKNNGINASTNDAFELFKEYNNIINIINKKPKLDEIQYNPELYEYLFSKGQVFLLLYFSRGSQLFNSILSSPIYTSLQYANSIKHLDIINEWKLIQSKGKNMIQIIEFQQYMLMIILFKILGLNMSNDDDFDDFFNKPFVKKLTMALPNSIPSSHNIFQNFDDDEFIYYKNLIIFKQILIPK